MIRRFSEEEYLRLLAEHVEQIGVLCQSPRLFGGRIGVWRTDIRDAVDDLMESQAPEG